MNIPNILTSLRVLLIPCIVVVFYLPFSSWAHHAAAGIFALAAITDWFDGFLARKLDQTTAFGAFLDPVADKLMVCVALVLLVDSYPYIYLTIPAMVIIGREIVISALREWMAELGKRASVAVSMIGKIKTALQMLAIFLLLGADKGTMVSYVGLATLYLAAAMTLWSMWIYLRAAWPELKEDL